MTDEEKDSIEILNNTELDINTIDSVDLHTYNYAVKTVLNLIEKKDKIIDEMAKYISEIDTSEEICENIDCDENTNIHTGEIDCKNCIKEYFKKKVEGK